MSRNASYQVCVGGRLDQRWLRWFEGHTVQYLDDGKTLIKLTSVDQPSLFGVINRIRDLGIELISVQKDVQERSQGGQRAESCESETACHGLDSC